MSIVGVIETGTAILIEERYLFTNGTNLSYVRGASIPNQMTFSGKVPNAGVIFNPKNYIAVFLANNRNII